MDFHVRPFDVFVVTMFVYVATFQLTYVSSGFVVALSQYFCHLITFCLFIKFVVIENFCYRDITTTSLFSFFVVALSQHICLAFFLSHCRNKVLRCRNIRLLSLPDNCCDRGFHVATDFSCLALLFPK